MFEIALRHFRSFHNMNSVEIRPLTILTGENSSGKSSFQAGARFLLESCTSAPTANFNKEPFFLGSFDQIAHFRGGKAGRAPEIEFAIRGTARARTRREAQQLSLFESQNRPKVEIRLYYIARLGQPSLSRLQIAHGNYLVEFKRFEKSNDDEEHSITLHRGASVKPIPMDGMVIPRFDQANQNIDIIISLLRQISLFQSRDTGKRHKEDLEIVSGLASLAQVFIRSLPNRIFAGAPVRSKPSRTYDPTDSSPSAEGTHVPFQIAELVRSDKANWDRVRSAFLRFGRAAGLFNDISIKTFGKNSGDPFQIYFTIGGPRNNIADVGYGVSQVMPIVFDLVNTKTPQVYFLQQPEVHLHPRAQAELGTFLSSVAGGSRSYLLVETHSDYIIDRIRRAVRDGDVKSSEVSILFFQRMYLESRIHQINILQDGSLDNVPSGYRNFFLRETIENLGLN